MTLVRRGVSSRASSKSSLRDVDCKNTEGILRMVNVRRWSSPRARVGTMTSPILFGGSIMAGILKQADFPAPVA